MMILQTSGLTRRFGNLTAVDGLNLTVAEGEVFGLLGPNGAGKTTVIKMLTTLLPPTAGTATVAGFDIRQRQAATVRFAGIPGFQSVAERWTNLVDRVEISPNIAPTNGRFNYTDNQ